jgi:hypothetical protein
MVPGARSQAPAAAGNPTPNTPPQNPGRSQNRRNGGSQ